MWAAPNAIAREGDDNFQTDCHTATASRYPNLLSSIGSLHKWVNILASG